MRIGGRPTLRKAAHALLLFFAGTTIALLLGELAIRIVAPQQLILLRSDIWRPMDSLGWAHRPNVHTRVNTGDRTVTFITDRSGFRVGERGRPDARYHILLLGDSFMAAMQVEYEQSLSGLIESCMVDRTGQTAAVWNTAVAGWDPPQYYFQALRTLGQERFDLVLVAVFLGNDVVTHRQALRPREPDPRKSFRIPNAVSWDEIVDAVLAPLNDGLETRSHLFILLKNQFRGLLMRAGLTALEVPSELRRDQVTSPRWQLTGEILSGIDSMAAARGVPTLIVLIPSIEEVDPSVLRDRVEAFGIDPNSLDIGQPERLMMEELQRRRLTVLSLTKPLREAQARGLKLYGQADPHPSADGQRVMWDATAPAIARLLHLPYNAPPGRRSQCESP